MLPIRFTSCATVACERCQVVLRIAKPTHPSPSRNVSLLHMELSRGFHKFFLCAQKNFFLLRQKQSNLISVIFCFNEYNIEFCLFLELFPLKKMQKKKRARETSDWYSWYLFFLFIISSVTTSWGKM